MKTPEEIKKGLGCCMVEECFGERENCPYTADPALCVGVMCEDALAYIQQLEAKVTNLERVRATQATSVTTMQDVLFKQQLHQSRLLEERSQLEARVPRWIPVEERLPESKRVVLVCTDGSKEMLICYHDGEEWVVCYDGEYASYDYTITHWMALPEPPEEVQE